MKRLLTTIGIFLLIAYPLSLVVWAGGGIYKNVASQKIAVFAWDGAAGAAKTGDAANITAEISKDGAASAATDDTSPTELDATDHPGIYIFDTTQAETNADMIVLTPASATADVIFRPTVIYTVNDMSGDIDAILLKVTRLRN